LNILREHPIMEDRRIHVQKSSILKKQHCLLRVRLRIHLMDDLGIIIVTFTRILYLHISIDRPSHFPYPQKKIKRFIEALCIANSIA